MSKSVEKVADTCLLNVLSQQSLLKNCVRDRLTMAPSLQHCIVEACVAERLTTRTLNLEVRGSSLIRHVVSLDKELYTTLSLLTQVYKWVPATHFWG